MEYFSLHETLTRNATINIIVGQRSSGKTYAFKDWCFRDWIKTGKEWVYVRRYKEELRTKDLFFDDIIDKYPEYEIQIKGMYCKIRKKGDKTWLPFGYFIPLSQQQQYKSTPMPNVNKICFDEFIIENIRNRYIPNEVNQFLSLYGTIARHQRNVKALLLSNAGAINNPYFIKYGVTSKEIYESKWIRKMNGHVLIHYYENKNNEEYLKNSVWGKVSTEDYKEYAFANMFSDANESFVLYKKPTGMEYYCTLTDGEQCIDVYWNPKYSSGTLWVKMVKKQGKIAFSCNPLQPILNAPYQPKLLKKFKSWTNQLLVTYATPESRNLWYSMLTGS